jgi:nucleoid-associated protein YgaU
MSPHRTTSILQRLPVILAVTAASYGLPAQVQAQRPSSPDAAAAAAPARMNVQDALATAH